MPLRGFALPLYHQLLYIPMNLKHIKIFFLLLSCALPLSVGNLDVQAANPKATKFNLTPNQWSELGQAGQIVLKKSAEVWTLSNGAKVYNSEKAGEKIVGYSGQTPLLMAVSKQGQITGITLLENTESEEYLDYVLSEKLLQRWNGKTLQQAANFSPDAVSGATYTSTAIIETVNATAAKFAKNGSKSSAKR